MRAEKWPTMARAGKSEKNARINDKKLPTEIKMRERGQGKTKRDIGRTVFVEYISETEGLQARVLGKNCHS